MIMIIMTNKEMGKIIKNNKEDRKNINKIITIMEIKEIWDNGEIEDKTMEIDKEIPKEIEKKGK